ncbi:MAG: tetratricopeptide repeat protein, partial [Saprospiraceae bacterium]|nr:tetratricopeptide repeat protein [Saprospiraceae bacterium]
MIITIVLVRGNPDSLWIKWQDQNLADSARAEAFLDYVYEDYFLSDADSALILFDELNHFAQERNLEGIRVEILKAVGYLYFRTGRYEEALATYEQGLVIAERIHDDLGAADILLRTGYIYHDNEDLIKALSYYQKSLKIYQRL